ncbi:hypothetical protein EV700_2585 [Fluviicoccus keumensis]|uniref:Uncharacterized protein n=1 Tax=Fluviicoccus keumensis TaxID=1435465 RepID=A0A4Q7YMP8_9GAMM|nr:hypothetical protein [Fluviicoccus keumensis]RZU38650.1 hypothetical protein EV700_2585 [Fluviicoccus keumensis]
MNTDRHPLAPASLAILAGIALWGLTTLITHRREPWDNSAYWLFTYPLAIAAAILLSHRYPQQPAVLSLLVFESQFVAMAVNNREIGNLWPMGMMMFAVIAVPAILGSQWAARRSPHRQA